MTSKNAAIDLAKHIQQLAGDMRTTANRVEPMNGRMTPKNVALREQCRHIDRVLNLVLIFSRDTEHHTSGFLKNPDYERCYHLSLSRLPGRLIVPGRVRGEGIEPTLRFQVVKAFFGDDMDKIWFESAKSKEGIRLGVTHWRLFCDEHWRALLPRKEVYSKDFTDIGWRSASQVWEEDGVLIQSTVDPT